MNCIESDKWHKDGSKRSVRSCDVCDEMEAYRGTLNLFTESSFIKRDAKTTYVMENSLKKSILNIT